MDGMWFERDGEIRGSAAYVLSAVVVRKLRDFKEVQYRYKKREKAMPSLHDSKPPLDSPYPSLGLRQPKEGIRAWLTAQSLKEARMKSVTPTTGNRARVQRYRTIHRRDLTMSQPTMCYRSSNIISRLDG